MPEQFAQVHFRVTGGVLRLVTVNGIALALSEQKVAVPDIDLYIPIEVMQQLLANLRGVETVEVVVSENQLLFRLPNLEFQGTKARSTCLITAMPFRPTMPLRPCLTGPGFRRRW